MDKFMRQLSCNYTAGGGQEHGQEHGRGQGQGQGQGGRRMGSKRWSVGGGGVKQQVEGMMGYYAGESGVVMKKRVVVVIDHSTRSKHAMMWALTHVANKGDLLTLLHVVSPRHAGEDSSHLANSLGSLCKLCKPEVELEALVIRGPKLETVLSQVKKLEASVLVLTQNNPSPFCCIFRSKEEDFIDQCINTADCLTMAVRKQSGGLGGYLVSTRWQKNFWLLA